jgi:hypothetical protein
MRPKAFSLRAAELGRRAHGNAKLSEPENREIQVSMSQGLGSRPLDNLN